MTFLGKRFAELKTWQLALMLLLSIWVVPVVIGACQTDSEYTNLRVRKSLYRPFKARYEAYEKKYLKELKEISNG